VLCDAGRPFECSYSRPNDTLGDLTGSDVIMLQCHVTYSNWIIYSVYPEFSCSTEPKTLVECGQTQSAVNLSRNNERAPYFVITASYSQQVQVDSRLNGGRLICTLQFRPVYRHNGVPHTVYNSSWTSSSITVQSRSDMCTFHG